MKLFNEMFKWNDEITIENFEKERVKDEITTGNFEIDIGK